jgi:formamidase
MLSGPIEVEGADPGDLLVVDILELGPCQAPQEKAREDQHAGKSR